MKATVVLTVFVMTGGRIITDCRMCEWLIAQCRTLGNGSWVRLVIRNIVEHTHGGVGLP